MIVPDVEHFTVLQLVLIVGDCLPWWHAVISKLEAQFGSKNASYRHDAPNCDTTMILFRVFLVRNTDVVNFWACVQPHFFSTT